MSADDHVIQLYAQLEKAISGSDQGRIITFCDRILAAHPADVFASRCKATVLIHSGKYELALAALQKLLDSRNKFTSQAKFAGMTADSVPTDDDRLDTVFSMAYCMYRLNRFADVRDLLAASFGADQQGLPAQAANLLAQAHYNLEEYPAAVAIYERLLKEGAYRDDQEQEELVNNLIASYAAINADKARAALQLAEQKTPDMLYNAATALVEARRFPEALQVLDDAAKLYAREFAEENGGKTIDFLGLGDVAAPLPKAERAFFDAIAMTQVQRAFVLYVQGDEAASERILKVVLHHKPTAVSTYAVACTNWAAIKRHNDFFDSHRKLKHAMTPAVEAKLTRRQRLLIKYNTAMLMLHTGRLAACRNAIEQMAAENPNSDLVPLAMVAMLLRDNKIAKAEETLAKFFKEQAGSTASGNSGSAQLTVAQIKVEQGDLPAALAALRAIDKFKYRPAAIATLAEGYASLGEIETARAIIQDAAANIDAKLKADLMVWAGHFYARNGLPADAVEAFDAAAKANKTLAPKLLPATVLSLAEFDIKAATEKARQLTPLTSSVDAAAIEQVALPRQKLVERGFHRQGEGHDIDGPRKAAKGPRRRPNRRPAKNADPSKKPDPERWIPISIRTYIVDLPPKRKRDLRRARAEEQYVKRKQGERRRREAAEAAAAAAAAGAAGAESSTL